MFSGFNLLSKTIKKSTFPEQSSKKKQGKAFFGFYFNEYATYYKTLFNDVAGFKIAAQAYNNLGAENDGEITPAEIWRGLEKISGIETKSTKRFQYADFKKIYEKDIESYQEEGLTFTNFLDLAARCALATEKHPVVYSDYEHMVKDEPQFNAIWAAFYDYDADSSHTLDSSELKGAFDKLKVTKSDQQIQDMIEATDLNYDGVLQFAEFLLFAAMDPTMNYEDQHDPYMALIAIYDSDKDGFINKVEMKGCLHSINVDLSDSEIDALFLKYDTDGDNVICYEEFKKVVAEYNVLSKDDA